MAYGPITITTSATLIVAPNPRRKALQIVNTSTGTVYVGEDASITTATGFPLLQNQPYTEDSGGNRMWQGPIYGIVASSTSDVRYWEKV